MRHDQLGSGSRRCSVARPAPRRRPPRRRGLASKKRTSKRAPAPFVTARLEPTTQSFYTQAAGHPEWGITGFELNLSGGAPEGKLKRIRVDVPPGLAADPQAPAPT